MAYFSHKSRSTLFPPFSEFGRSYHHQTGVYRGVQIFDLLISRAFTSVRKRNVGNILSVGWVLGHVKMMGVF